MKQINQKFICLFDGEERSSTNGDEAIAELEKEHKYYSPTGIFAKEKSVVLVVRDITKDLRTRNEGFIAEHKRQFGYQPNPFDGI